MLSTFTDLGAGCSDLLLRSITRTLLRKYIKLLSERYAFESFGEIFYFSFFPFIFDSCLSFLFSIFLSRADKPAMLISATAGVGVAATEEEDGEGEGLFEGLFATALSCFVSKSVSSTKSTTHTKKRTTLRGLLSLK